MTKKYTYRWKNIPGLFRAQVTVVRWVKPMRAVIIHPVTGEEITVARQALEAK